jgi:hypothetical protein
MISGTKSKREGQERGAKSIAVLVILMGKSSLSLILCLVREANAIPKKSVLYYYCPNVGIHDQFE